MTTSHEPTADERRSAVCAAMGRAPSLVRYAARYCSSVDDAEDVYQRAMEIALTKAPTVEPDAFLAWLYTVVRNEALAVRQSKKREPVGRRADIATEDTAADESTSPERVAEWRERHRGVRDALDSLSQQQRTCVMLQSTGLTYEQISRVTGFSRRQIERSIARGRRRLAVWEDKLASGAACEQLRPTLDRILRGEATERDRRRAAKHTAACAACRTSMVRSYALQRTLAGLVPVGVLAGIDYEPLATDPGGALDLGERVALGAASRLTQIAAPIAELPLAGVGRVLAAAGAIAIACVAAVPFFGPTTTGKASVPPIEPVPITLSHPTAPTPDRLAPARVAPPPTASDVTPAPEVQKPRPATAHPPPAPTLPAAVRSTSPRASAAPAPPVQATRMPPRPSAGAEFSP